MLVGHYGVGLLLKSANKKLNLGWIFLAVMLPDILLGLFVLSGFEKAAIPQNYSIVHYLVFDFPYSHGFTATIVWTMIIALLIKLFWPKADSNKNKAIIVLGVAFFSHFILDLMVHIPEIPLLGSSSAKIGLGLWNIQPLALVLELLIAAISLTVYFAVNKEKSLKAKIGIPVIMGILSIFTASQLFSPTPPESMINIIAVQWIVTGVGISLLGFWLGNETQKKIKSGVIKSNL